MDAIIYQVSSTPLLLLLWENIHTHTSKRHQPYSLALSTSLLNNFESPPPFSYSSSFFCAKADEANKQRLKIDQQQQQQQQKE